MEFQEGSYLKFALTRTFKVMKHNHFIIKMKKSKITNKISMVSRLQMKLKESCKIPFVSPHLV